ncbi:MAG: hypothetical protein IPN01_33690 [Deltaproteobacteria bacterium]|nr:hypothetical protein [Deltaproteobacteria bacterium]
MSPRPRVLLGVAGLFALLVLPRVAPATVAEQRARLPPPKACDDPVAGVWMSHQYSERRGTWDQFTLTIHRDPAAPGRLNGTIHNHVWEGGPADERPPPCEGQLDVVVRMNAEGPSRRPQAALRRAGLGGGVHDLPHERRLRPRPLLGHHRPGAARVPVDQHLR